MAKHSSAVPGSFLLPRALQGRNHTELTAATPCLEVHSLDWFGTQACLGTKTAVLLQIRLGKALEGIDVGGSVVSSTMEVYKRVRAFVHTCA